MQHQIIEIDWPDGWKTYTYKMLVQGEKALTKEDIFDIQNEIEKYEKENKQCKSNDVFNFISKFLKNKGYIVEDVFFIYLKIFLIFIIFLSII